MWKVDEKVRFFAAINFFEGEKHLGGLKFLKAFGDWNAVNAQPLGMSLLWVLGELLCHRIYISYCVFWGLFKLHALLRKISLPLEVSGVIRKPRSKCTFLLKSVVQLYAKHFELQNFDQQIVEFCHIMIDLEKTFAKSQTTHPSKFRLAETRVRELERLVSTELWENVSDGEELNTRGKITTDNQLLIGYLALLLDQVWKFWVQKLLQRKWGRWSSKGKKRHSLSCVRSKLWYKEQLRFLWRIFS